MSKRPLGEVQLDLRLPEVYLCVLLSANTFLLTRRIDNLPTKPRTRHEPLEDPSIMRAHVEVPMLFLGLLRH